MTRKKLVPMLTAALVATLLLTACGSSAPVASPTTTATTTRPALESNAAVISVSTKMICGEAAEDIETALATKTTEPLIPTWNDHIYSCRYVYPHGVMRLSVKQLGSAAETGRYFDMLAATLGKRTSLAGLGQGAFTTTNQSVVVRKDFKVLVVDVHGLPSMFGTPPDTRANAAITVAATIMGCWTGE